MRIRVATEADIGRIVELCAEMIQDGAFAGEEIERPWVEMNVKAALNSKTTLVLVTENDTGHVVGFCSGYVSTSIFNSKVKAAEHHIVYVAKMFRCGRKSHRAVEIMLRTFFTWAELVGAKRFYFAPSYYPQHDGSWDRMAARLGFKRCGAAYRRSR